MSRDRSVILVVDDEERIRRMLGEQLESEGYEVILAASGDDAFGILLAGLRVDLIITDVRMPGIMNGFDLVEQAISRQVHLKTIVISGYTGERYQRAALSDCFLHKPFTFDTLHSKVKGLLHI